LGKGGGEGLQTIESPDPPHPNPLPDGERERADFAARRQSAVDIPRFYNSIAPQAARISAAAARTALTMFW
jgi:hypothetical protein